MTRVKICGLREVDHAVAALEAGAELLGFVFAPSKRQISPPEAAKVIRRCRELFPPDRRPWEAVGVFANQPLEVVREVAASCGVNSIQLSGRESPDYCRRLTMPLYRAVHVPELLRSRQVGPAEGKEGLRRRLAIIAAASGAARLLLDSGGSGRWGGTGEPFPWEELAGAAGGCLVAGGLNPGNVRRAVQLLRPWGVDVSSGVEHDGRKDPELIRAFIAEAKGTLDGSDAPSRS